MIPPDDEACRLAFVRWATNKFAKGPEDMTQDERMGLLGAFVAGWVSAHQRIDEAFQQAGAN